MKISDEAIVAAILSNSTNRDAAVACGLSEKQFYSRLSTPSLKAKLAEARARLLENATTAILARVGEAVETMANIMRDEKSPAQTRLNACDAIVRNALRMGEQIDVLNRVEALEKAALRLEAKQ